MQLDKQNMFAFIDKKLKAKKEDDSYRHLDFYVDKTTSHIVEKNGKKLISFCCNDYLGLSHNLQIKQKVKENIDNYPLGSTGSRFISGNSSLYKEIEEMIAMMKNTDNALVFGSGYLANIGVISSLVSRKDLVIADKLIHSSIIDGIKLSGAKLIRFRHNDVNHAEELLKQYRNSYDKCLVISETVFSMDGDRGKITELLELAKIYNSILISDDAHGFGLFDKNKQLSSDYHIQIGTLSKAIGCYGGYVAANNMFIDYFKNFAKSVIYSTALPPIILLSIIEALKIINKNPDLGKIPIKKAKLFASKFGIANIESPIIPIITGSSKKAMDLAKVTEEQGFFIQAIRPPTVEMNKARIRLTFSALHKDEDVCKLAEFLHDEIFAVRK